MHACLCLCVCVCAFMYTYARVCCVHVCVCTVSLCVLCIYIMLLSCVALHYLLLVKHKFQKSILYFDVNKFCLFALFHALSHRVELGILSTFCIIIIIIMSPLCHKTWEDLAKTGQQAEQTQRWSTPQKKTANHSVKLWTPMAQTPWTSQCRHWDKAPHRGKQQTTVSHCGHQWLRHHGPVNAGAKRSLKRPLPINLVLPIRSWYADWQWKLKQL